MTNIAFQTIPIAENGDPMVDLKEYPFALSPEYFNVGLSDSPELWTRKAIADKLLDIQTRHLDPRGWSFKIWDPWRSRVVQANIYNKFWNELKEAHPEWDDEKLKIEVGVFVTKPDDPNRIPPHATGGSIDLTIVDANGVELDMGTIFDHFGPEAATEYSISPEVDENRRFFHAIMAEAGFGNDIDEWWHFDYGNQKWALFFGLSQALYGEITDPVAFNRNLDHTGVKTGLHHG